MAGAEMRRAHSLEEIRTFLQEECNLGSIFYSSEISQRPCHSWRPFSFDCVLERRRRELVDARLIFEIATVEVLVGVVTTLVKCSTWTNAKFQFRCGRFGPVRDESTSEVVFERRMFEAYYLHRSSPRLLCLDVSCDLAYSRARHEMRTVRDARAEKRELYTHFRAFLEALAGGVSHNSALKSLTLHIAHQSWLLSDAKSLELLFTSASLISVKELVLHFQDCEPWNNCATFVNLVRWNATLEKLTLMCSSQSWSPSKDVTYTWTSENHGRALQVKYSGTDFFPSAGLIEPLAANFSPGYSPDGIFPRGTDVSTLHLILPLDQGIISTRNLCRPSKWEKTFRDNMLSVVTSVATMSARSTTLKHVQMSFEWDSQVNMMCSCRKQVELWTQKKLRKIMVGNELRGNTSLETLEVGYSKLTRRAQHVGGATDEWHTSYAGPCLRPPSNEYVVKVRM